MSPLVSQRVPFLARLGVGKNGLCGKKDKRKATCSEKVVVTSVSVSTVVTVVPIESITQKSLFRGFEGCRGAFKADVKSFWEKCEMTKSSNLSPSTVHFRKRHFEARRRETVSEVTGDWSSLLGCWLKQFKETLPVQIAIEAVQGETSTNSGHNFLRG